MENKRLKSVEPLTKLKLLRIDLIKRFNSNGEEPDFILNVLHEVLNYLINKETLVISSDIDFKKLIKQSILRYDKATFGKIAEHKKRYGLMTYKEIVEMLASLRKKELKK